MSYTKLQKRYVNLKTEIIGAIQTAVGNNKIDIEHEDECNNNLVAVDKYTVFFCGGAEEYPLDELSIKDMLEILSILEQ